MKWYLVGGAVRDMLLGRTPREKDYAFAADADAMIRAYPSARKVGRSVNVCLLHGVECMPLRGGSIEADLAARDLTINALALEVGGMVHAHPLALHDLRAGILRPASATAFAEDPVRIFRLARFAAAFPDFTVHAEALAQAGDVARSNALYTLPAERVGNEVRKALRADRPSRFIRVLHQCEALNPWFAELHGAADIPGGPPLWHQDSVLRHTENVMDAVRGDEYAVWMALCHDLGKVTTEASILPHHYGHEERGVALACALGKRLTLPARMVGAGVLAAREHMKGGIFSRLRTGTRRDLLHGVHAAGLDTAFWQMVDADCGLEVSPVALRALACMLEVKLPPQWRNKGKESGRKLRTLQCEALAALRHGNLIP